VGGTRRPPIALVHGVQRTNRGLGLLVEKIVGRDGTVAPTLAALILDGRFDERLVGLVDDFFGRCRECHVVLGDVHPQNLVHSEAYGAREEIVLVDGYGEHNVIPIHRWSRRLNDRKIGRHRGRLMERIDWLIDYRRRHGSAPLSSGNGAVGSGADAPVARAWSV
jgi:hypothetical protein